VDHNRSSLPPSHGPDYRETFLSPRLFSDLPPVRLPRWSSVKMNAPPPDEMLVQSGRTGILPPIGLSRSAAVGRQQEARSASPPSVSAEKDRPVKPAAPR